MGPDDERTDKPPSNEIIITKGWSWDWDIGILNLFKKRKTENVVSPEALCEQSMDVSTPNNQDIHESDRSNSR